MSSNGFISGCPLPFKEKSTFLHLHIKEFKDEWPNNMDFYSQFKYILVLVSNHLGHIILSPLCRLFAQFSFLSSKYDVKWKHNFYVHHVWEQRKSKISCMLFAFLSLSLLLENVLFVGTMSCASHITVSVSLIQFHIFFLLAWNFSRFVFFDLILNVPITHWFLFDFKIATFRSVLNVSSSVLSVPLQVTDHLITKEFQSSLIFS